MGLCKGVAGTMMHSLEGAEGSLRLTSSNPSFAIVVTCRYLLASLTLVSFFVGLVPWARWACVQQRSLHSDWIANQDVWVVNGSLALACVAVFSISFQASGSRARAVN